MRFHVKGKLAPVATQMNLEELEIPAKKPCILALPKETDVKKIDLGTSDLEKMVAISAHLLTK
jgi:hypothetical protein